MTLTAPPRLVTDPPPDEPDVERPLGVKHVLIIVQNNPVPLDRRVWLQCRALVATGYDVSVICPMDVGDPSFEVIDGVALHKYDPGPEPASAPAFIRSYARAWLLTAHRAFRIARTKPIHVLQACNPPDTYFPLAAMLRRRGTRFLFDQHDLCPEIFTARFGDRGRWYLAILAWLERATHRFADHVITVNESCRDLLINRTSTPAERVTVVRTGVDLSRLRRIPADPGLKSGRRFLCCYLGMMGPQDGVETVIHAADRIVHDGGRDDVHFALLGFGERLEALRELTRGLHLERHVTFVGRADDATIAAYLSTADIGLQPDASTPFNNVCSMLKTVEYMAFGLPVIAYDLVETCRTAGNAAMTVDGGVDEFALAINRLLDDPARRRAMAAAGQARTRGPLQWDVHRRAYLDVVGSLAARADVRARA